MNHPLSLLYSLFLRDRSGAYKKIVAFDKAGAID